MKNENLVPVLEFCQINEVENGLVNHLYSSGIIHLVKENQEYYILKEEIPFVEKWVSFHKELDINIPGLEVISYLLPRMEAQLQEIQELKSLLHFYQNWQLKPDRDWSDLE